MLLLDLTHTSHTGARTGIQQLTRALHAQLAGRVEPVTRDPYLNVWRRLESWERANLDDTAATTSRSARWPRWIKWRGRVLHASGLAARRSLQGQAAGLIVPELFSPTVARSLPALFAHVAGPRVAVFYDAIPLKLPELTPAATVARFPGYLRELLAFDGIAAISEDSRAALVDYWEWLGVASPPVVSALPLGITPPLLSAESAVAPEAVPIVLSVGSIEGRKNHVALFEACEQLWAAGRRFELRIIGLAQRPTGTRGLERLQALQAAGRPLRYDGAASDATVRSAYAGCAFTVYPSLMEGFGLPVLESLGYGKPCICSARGALGEAAAGGGCLTLPHVDAFSLAAAIDELLSAPERRAALTAEARRRRFRTWSEYAQALVAFTQSVPVRRTGN
ncbi:glycosyltransferase [Horticoccus luteus]|uniref:Glycosyltransferase n=1 Tax=Horticoccus luteus TaxID=2862869 RepID=A0A8F9U0B8_9BACT|nr:glycosyltransferase [Horticoccus luteus]QYM80807.1 glycosyltransferase [Horticoccus luteus]